MIALLRPALIVCLLASNGVNAEREAKARAVLLVANKHDDTLCFIDLVRSKHITQIPTGKFTRVHGTAIAPDGKHAYFTAGQTGFVVEVDTRTNRVTRGIPTHGKISHMARLAVEKVIKTGNGPDPMAWWVPPGS